MHPLTLIRKRSFLKALLYSFPAEAVDIKVKTFANFDTEAGKEVKVQKQDSILLQKVQVTPISLPFHMKYHKKEAGNSVSAKGVEQSTKGLQIININHSWPIRQLWYSVTGSNLVIKQVVRSDHA